MNTEIARAEKSMGEYSTIVFKVIPCIIVAAALLIIFMDKPQWRAACITIIGMMAVILSVDINANTRVEAYHDQLLKAELQAVHHSSE